MCIRDRTPSRLLDALVDAAADWGHPVWLVGGTVRDRELGRFSPDIDAVTAGDPAELTARVARLVDLPWFPLSHEFGAYRVVGDVARGGGGRGDAGGAGAAGTGRPAAGLAVDADTRAGAATASLDSAG